MSNFCFVYGFVSSALSPLCHLDVSIPLR